jgi:hypothetical protein
MFNYDDLDVQQELAHIPPEYQDIFRQALEHELAELEEDQTDTEILHYLRRRRDDFRRGGLIRPDGRPGIVVADPEMLYEHGLLGLPSLSEDEEATRERRRSRLKAGGFLLLACLFLFFIFRGRAQRQGDEGANETPAAVAVGEATATATLPDMAGADDSLQTIGGLGAALTIGRPSAIELRYLKTEEIIALAIDPSRATPRGELRYNEITMASDNPVAVWLFGTVVNYGIGLPDSLVRNLQPGDRIVLSTDTGASLAFIVTETRQASSHETAAVLSQNRPGMTLFALPAAADDDVALAFAAYDVTTEELDAQTSYQVGEAIVLPGWGEIQVERVQIANTADGSLRIVIEGATTPMETTGQTGTLMLSLTATGSQTPAAPLVPAADGAWQATFVLSDAGIGLPLFAELRALPGGAPAMVRLGDLPDLQAQLELSVSEAYWDVETNQAALHVDVHNPGEGAVYLDSNYFRIWAEGVPHEGGDAYELSGQVVPSLPLLVGPGETLGMSVAFPLLAQGPAAEPVSRRPNLQLQIGADLWELSGFGALTTGRQP